MHSCLNSQSNWVTERKYVYWSFAHVESGQDRVQINPWVFTSRICVSFDSLSGHFYTQNNNNNSGNLYNAVSVRVSTQRFTTIQDQ